MSAFRRNRSPGWNHGIKPCLRGPVSPLETEACPILTFGVPCNVRAALERSWGNFFLCGLEDLVLLPLWPRMRGDSGFCYCPRPSFPGSSDSLGAICSPPALPHMPAAPFLGTRTGVHTHTHSVLLPRLFLPRLTPWLSSLGFPPHPAAHTFDPLWFGFHCPCCPHH